MSLVAATIALVLCVLVVSATTVTYVLRASLVERIDATLMDATVTWAKSPWKHAGPRGEGPDASRPPSKFFVRAVSPDGQTMTAINDRHAEPALPADNDVGPVPTTVASISGSRIKWRAVTVRGAYGGVTTVAIDLADVDRTVELLIALQVGIGVAVLAAVGFASYAMVRRNLRPLIEVEHTAADIAAGRLDRRITERDPRTEVGQLSLALNGMLSQIQKAVAASETSAEKAHASEDLMRRFITDASHELRTPLTTIRGFAELYRQGAASDVSMLLSRIESEAGRMGLLVEDLLLLARLDAQRPLEMNRVDLLGLASDAVHDGQALDPQRIITMEVLDGPGIPEVLGEEARLRQVLSNLVANAIHHTPHTADVTVRVGTEGENVLLEVADNGPGMGQQDAQRIFGRFYRTDSSRARSSGGSGLGLSIVDSLVRAHGGSITVTTAPGEGCCFRVTLPRVDDGSVEAD